MNSPASNVFFRFKLFAAFLLLLPSVCAGQDSIVRPVSAAYTVEAGSAHICDTYLTPLHYSGWTTAIGYSRSQAVKFAPRIWTGSLDARLKLGRTLNPARNAAMWDVDFNISASLQRRFALPAGFTLSVGPDLRLQLGALSLMRNGNNPVSAKAAIIAGAAARLGWKGQLGRLPVSVFTKPLLDLLGAFFSPDYDELYYEIWLGNHSGLAHFAWPGNFLHFENLLAADLHFGATTLRLGYRLEVGSTSVSDIVTRNISHSFVVGICNDWISLRSNARRTPDAEIISSY